MSGETRSSCALLRVAFVAVLDPAPVVPVQLPILEKGDEVQDRDDAAFRFVRSLYERTDAA